MPYRLNVDMWHVVNPEDQKITRLSRGDEVPSWALPEGDELEEATSGTRPVFLKDEDDRPTPSTPKAAVDASDAGGVRSESPQQPRDKK